MSTGLYSRIHFFDTLMDIVVSQPYAILCLEEVNSLIDQIDSLTNKTDIQCAGFECACALRQAVHNAMSDDYFPIVILSAKKYEAAVSFVGGA